MTNQLEFDLGLPESPDNKEWRELAMPHLIELAHSGRTFQAYDLTEAGCPDPPHPNCWGSLFLVAMLEGWIEAVGWTYSRRPTRPGGTCREWVGTVTSQAA